jgi:hypothetical protein
MREAAGLIGKLFMLLIFFYIKKPSYYFFVFSLCSVVTIHVQGQDLKTGNTLRGALHLVDLAGSERVDRSAVTGDRLKEAQHINKSLAALGDVIFSLSQKNAHVPYRNSKLTQVLQTSLGDLLC